MTRIRHAQHVHQRLQQRYQLLVTEEELVELEDALNTLEPLYFYGRKDHVERCMFEWKDQIIEAIMSMPAYHGNRRHLLTVLQKP